MKSTITMFYLLAAVTGLAQNTDSTIVSQPDLIKQADSLMTRYQFDKALHILAKCDSLDTSIMLRIGQCNFRLGASGAAIRPYERVLSIDSTNLTALNQLGQLYGRGEDFRSAFEIYLRLIEIDSANSYYYKQAGTMALHSEDKPTARFWYRLALDLNPADVETSVALGTLLLEMEEYKLVDTLAERALAHDPLFKPILMLKAKSAFKQQKHGLVVAIVNNLLETSDTTLTHARLLGTSYFSLHDYARVITCMNFMLKNRYDGDWIYYYLGIASRELGDVSASIKYFKAAVQKSISENISIYYYQLGKSYEEMKNYRLAIRAYQSGYNYSKEGILLYHMARNYDVNYKEKALALKYYKKYLASDDTIRSAKQYARQRVHAMGQF